MSYRPPEVIRVQHTFDAKREALKQQNPKHDHKPFDPTPARRLYREKGGQGPAGATSPAPSFFNTSTGNNHNNRSVSALSGGLPPIATSPVPPAQPNVRLVAPPSIVEAPRAKTHLGFIASLPSSSSKSGPARSKMKPTGTAATRAMSQARSESSMSTTGGGSGAAWLGGVSANFESDMAEISHISGINDSGVTPAPTPGPGERPTNNGSRAPSSMASIVKTEEVSHVTTAQDPATKPVHVPYAPDVRSKPSATAVIHTHTAPRTMCLRDYVMLAEACQRAGKARMEGHAYYKIGELYASKPETRPKALVYFTKYLNICRRLNDLQGEAKALNCIGITYHEMGGVENLTQALDFHKQHSEVADAAGVFISHTNMGLIHTVLGNNGKSIDCHKIALQYAVRAGDKQAESLALSHLGRAERQHGDLATAKVCLDRHVELATSLKDYTSVCTAQEQLGVLALERKDFSLAADCFAQALDVALQHGDYARATSLRCQLGLSKGMEGVTGHVSEVSESMGARLRK
eukprot:PhM_4_TR10286/c0_g1_i1/m.57105